MRLIMLFVYLLLVLVGVSFAALNASNVDINFYFKTVSMPISVLMIMTLAIGLLVGFVLFIGKYWKIKIDYSKIKNQLSLTEREIKNLRDIPLKNQH